MGGLEGYVQTLRVNGNDYTMPALLAYWITEREAIRRAKEDKRPKPWSKDPVFQKTYFCNVHREHDKTTQWIRKNYTPKFMGDAYELSMVVARIFNHIPTLEHLKYDVSGRDFTHMQSQVDHWLEVGEQVWSGAYLISTNGRKMKKVDYCMELFRAANRLLPFGCDTLERYHRHLLCVPGMGNFLAGQVVADLKNTPGHILASADDWFSFSAPGPGSLRGLSWFFGKTVTPATYTYHITLASIHPEITKAFGYKQINMQDLQNCFCEFDKYCRVATGTGRSKRNYQGT